MQSMIFIALSCDNIHNYFLRETLSSIWVFFHFWDDRTVAFCFCSSLLGGYHTYSSSTDYVAVSLCLTWNTATGQKLESCNHCCFNMKVSVKRSFIYRRHVWRSFELLGQKTIHLASFHELLSCCFS